jgi:ATP-dependent helicase/DNAse subunit B
MGRTVYRQEADFSKSPAVISGVAGDLLARGLIDRMDITDDGGLVVLDYKSGSKTPTTQEMEEGRNFQMMLYLLAAQQLFPEHPVIGGLFWSIKKNKADGIIMADDERIEAARLKLHEHVVMARQGDFASEPARREEGKCSKYCEYSQFCRINSS